ncbi:MAG: outer membrane protein assembly factor BamB family protein [Planctomycetota bacterium]
MCRFPVWATGLIMLVLCTKAIAAEADAQRRTLNIVIMDPLCERLACKCVAGYAQRKYEGLADHLKHQLGQDVHLTYTESLRTLKKPKRQQVDMIVGKYSVVIADARYIRLDVRTLAMLSGQHGKVTQTGLFVVRTKDKAKSIEDLSGYRMLFGPHDSDEKHAAALATLDVFGLPIPTKPPTASSCNTAALAVVEKDADVAVISSYAMPLLIGCSTIDKGALRIVGRTDPVPFICIFVTRNVSQPNPDKLLAALRQVNKNPNLLAALESKRGFVPLPHHYATNSSNGPRWTDWRGPNRAAISPDLPKTLPANPQLLWSRVLTGHGLSGIAVQSGRLIVADKDLDGNKDVFRCLDANTGRQIWMLTYPAQGDMDFTNAPRANPVIHQDLVYLLGAYGDLHCLKLATGHLVWKRNLAKDFATQVPTWGYCSTPLLVDDKLIINPGAKNASVAALDRKTGRQLWATPGEPPAYASFILARIKGVRQIIGYEAASLNAWDPQTGRRLWRLVPQIEGDFNVPTPVIAGDRLLVSSENNGTRLYAFDDRGRIAQPPQAQNDDLNPDTSTPVIYKNLVIGNAANLTCLDLDNNLQTLWQTKDQPFKDYCSLIAGNDRILVVTQNGKLRLLKSDRTALNCVSKLDLFEDLPARDREVWSHPALVGNRLYIRNSLAICCFLLN